MKKIRKGAIARHYRKKGKLYNCTIKGESNTVFELIFEDVPHDYNESFKIEVKPVFAKYSN